LRIPELTIFLKVYIDKRKEIKFNGLRQLVETTFTSFKKLPIRNPQYEFWILIHKLSDYSGFGFVYGMPALVKTYCVLMHVFNFLPKINM